MDSIFVLGGFHLCVLKGLGSFLYSPLGCVAFPFMWWWLDFPLLVLLRVEGPFSDFIRSGVTPILPSKQWGVFLLIFFEGYFFLPLLSWRLGVFFYPLFFWDLKVLSLSSQMLRVSSHSTFLRAWGIFFCLLCIQRHPPEGGSSVSAFLQWLSATLSSPTYGGSFTMMVLHLFVFLRAGHTSAVLMGARGFSLHPSCLGFLLHYFRGWGFPICPMLG